MPWRARGVCAAAALIAGLGTHGIARAEDFDVAPGPLGVVAASVGARAGITLILADSTLAARQSPGVRGRYSVRAAIAQILKGTGGEAVFHDAVTVRIVMRRQRAVRPKPAIVTVAPEMGEDHREIVVTASKKSIPLQHYPGSATIIDLDEDWQAQNAAGGTEALSSLLPILSTTNLGPSRNKLFLRGIADSSFNGPTQATVGQFLGDVRLTYNAPDPNLSLYDMKRVEVLSGPQGTLHGAGSLGGIIRIVPNAPDARAFAASGTMGASAIEKGGVGGDLAVMANFPLTQGRSALRLVAYVEEREGYIDAPLRGLKNINGTSVYGVRAALRSETDTGWTLDLGAVIQDTLTKDGQYTLRGDPPFTRNNAFAQPFENIYHLGYLAARRSMGKGELVSTTSLVRHELKTIFDATGYDGTDAAARFEERNGLLLFSHETRLSGGGNEAPWVVGLTGLYTVNGISRMLGPPGAMRRITGVVNEQTESALFGQISRPLSPTLTGTIGVRLTYARTIGHLTTDAGDGPDELARNQLRRSGTIAIEWHPRDELSLYYRYQQGYRAGGLAIAPVGAAADSQRFVADDLDLNEVGIRLRDRGDRFSARAALFHVGWANIQADLVDNRGLPYTANIGKGRIIGLEGEASWRPVAGLELSAAAFSNKSRLYDAAPQFVRSGQQPLPNVAEDGVRVAANWRYEIGPRASLASELSLRYVGESRLGVGPLLDMKQGDYLTIDLGSRLGVGAVGFSFRVTNLLDARGNSFAFGNPFTLSAGDQITPLQPRSVRFGVDLRF